MERNKYEQIRHAVRVLDLPETATLSEVKEQFRRLIIKWHPDKCRAVKEECERKAAEINEAYRTILEYISDFRFPFTEEALKEHFDDGNWWLNRFGDDPVWGRREDI